MKSYLAFVLFIIININYSAIIINNNNNNNVIIIINNINYFLLLRNNKLFIEERIDGVWRKLQWKHNRIALVTIIKKRIVIFVRARSPAVCWFLCGLVYTHCTVQQTLKLIIQAPVAWFIFDLINTQYTSYRSWYLYNLPLLVLFLA